MGTNNTGRPAARRWVPIDQILAALDDTREITLPPRTRPVDPAPDYDCYRLNPPEECYGAKQQAGIKRIARQADRTNS